MVTELRSYIEHEMKMQAVYQPVMVATLLRNGGFASDQLIISAFQATPEHAGRADKELRGKLTGWSNRRGAGPGQVLTENGVVERQGDGFRLLGYEQLTGEQVSDLTRLCEERLADYRQRNGRPEPEHPEGEAPDPADDPDGEVWRGAAAFRGVVRNGVIVFNNPRVALADGTEVQVKVRPHEFTPEETAEFAGWEKLGDEAWAMIDEWEREGPPRAAG